MARGDVESLILTFDGNSGFVDRTFRFGVQYIRVAYAPLDFQIYNGYGRSEPVRFVRAGERLDIELPVATDSLTFGWGIGAAVPGAEYAKAVLLLSSDPLSVSGGGESSLALAVYDSLGQIRGWEPLASSKSVANRNAALVYLENTSIPATISGTVQTEIVQKNTYDVVARRTARDYNTALVFGAAGRLPLATIWNPGGVTGRLLSADVALFSTTAAIEMWAELMGITSLPTGGSGLTPVNREIGGAASTILSRRVPTGGAAEAGDPLSSIPYALGITAAAATTQPPASLRWDSLYRPASAYEKNPTIESGKGLAIVVDVNAACTVRFAARLSFMEV